MIDLKNYNRVFQLLTKVRFLISFKRQVDKGEKVWEANRKARQFIDFNNDAEQGEFELLQLRKALPKWIAELEELRNAAKIISKRASKVIYQGRRNVEVTEDSSKKREPTQRHPTVETSREEPSE